MNNTPNNPDRDELQQQLWEYVYQLLDDDEATRVEELVSSDPDVARLYSEIKQQSGLLASAAQLEQAPVELNAPANSATTEKPAGASASSTGSRHVAGNWLVAIAASLLLAIVGYAYFQPASPLNSAAVALQEEQLGEQLPHIAVTAPQLVQAETDNQISVSVTTEEGEPRPADITFQVYSTLDGSQLIEEQTIKTDDHGLANLSIPGDKLNGPARVELVASYEGGRSKHISTHLELDQPHYATHLSLDKPLYRPGETIHYRSLTLSRFGMWPLDLTPVTFEILDAGGASVAGSMLEGVTQQGVGNGVFELPQGSLGGRYTLVARSTQGLFPEEKREFQVREYHTPQFTKELELVRDSYTPGEEVVADFAAWSSTGEELASTDVFVSATVDGTPLALPQPTGTTESDGTFRVKFTLPEQIETGEGVLVVAIDDGATRESIAETIPINLGKVEVEFYPEGGDLAAGLPNRVYFSATDPAGEPVHIEGRVLDSAGTEVTKLETEHEGRGRFNFTPTAHDVYKLVIDSPADVTSEPVLPAAKADLPIVLSSNEYVYDDKSPITVALNASANNGRYVVAAMCRGAQVGQMPLAKPLFKKVKQAKNKPQHYQAQLELPVSQAADGVIRLTVYDYSQATPRPVAERLVYRRPHKKLSVSVGGHSESYSPGAPVDLTLSVTDEHGDPQQAVLGLSVVDDSLLNLADDKSARMTTHFRLTTEVEQPQDLEDANFFLSSEDEAPSALDLLLGVQGWRRFVDMSADDYAMLAEAGEMELALPPIDGFANDAAAVDQQANEQQEQLTRLAQLNGMSQAPTWQDNSDTLASELAAAKQTFYSQREAQVKQLGFVLAVAAVVVLIGMLLVGLMRWSSGLIIWSPVMLAAVACLAVGVMWSRAYVEPSGQLAYAPLTFEQVGDMVAMNDRAVDSAASTASAPDEQATAEGEAGAMAPLLEMEMEEADPFAMPAEEAPMNDPAVPAAAAPPAPADAPMPKAAGRFMFGAGVNDDEGFAGPVGEAMPAQPGANRANFRQQGQAQGKQLADEKARDMLRRRMAPRDDFADLEAQGRGGFGGRGQADDLALRQLEKRKAQLQSRQFPVREYFHQHQSTDPDIREDFQESLAWQPLLRTNEQGKARVKFELSDSVTTFRVRVDAHSPASGNSTTTGRIGSGEGEVISRIPFQLEPKLPIEVTAGDRIDLPLAVINNSRENLTVKMGMEVSDLFALTGETHREVNLEAGGRNRQWVELNVVGNAGEAELTFLGESAGETLTLRDAIRKSVRVTPTGFPVLESYAGQIDGAQQLSIDLPERWIDGSLEVTLKAFPSSLADLQKGIDSILREPHGCFEQTSSSNYPNIMALQYMEEHDVADPTFTKRAKDLLDKGYQKLTTFESPNHGYEWFGGNPGHEALTAYGLMEFRDMDQVYEVNDQMVQRTAAWLMSRRDGTGGFRRNQRALDSFGQAPPDITDAYIVWALTEANQADIATELKHVIDLAQKSDDPYLIGMAARSALNAGKESVGVELLEKLKKLQADDGHLDAKNSTITRSGGLSMQVETTAIAAMAWLKHASGQQEARKAIEWIAASRQGTGGFGSSQATIMALKAMTEFSRANRKTTSAGELIARLEAKSSESTEPTEEPVDGTSDEAGPAEEEAPADDAITEETSTDQEQPAETSTESAKGAAVTKSVTFAAGDAEAIELTGLEALLKAGKNELTLDLTGDNQMPYVLDIRYRVDKPRSNDACPVRLTAELGSESVVMSESLPLKVTLENVSGQGQPMTTAILGIPAGLQVRTEQLDEMVKAGKFAYYELNAREVILYWRSLSPELTGEEKLGFTLDLLAEIPGKYTGPASRAYLYYTAEQKQWLEPLVVEVTKPE